jgi:catechol 2,3-dioxygenase-like lactoylglutathione lyase family enzyme
MEFSALTPELIVSDLAISQKFWCEVIGFSVWYERPEEGFVYLTLDSAQLMLEQQSDDHRNWINGQLQRPFGRGINFQIRVPSLDAVIERCQHHGIALFLPPEERWYRRGTEQVGQRQFMVADPDGYLARCIQPLGIRPLPQLPGK